MYYHVSLDEEMTQVSRAVEYYLSSKDILHLLDDESIKLYYRGLFASTKTRQLHFKALFFAMRLQPVMSYITDFQKTYHRPPSVLDVGCGFGLESILLAQLGARVHGLDGVDFKIAGAEKLQIAYEQTHGCQLELHYEAANLFHFQPIQQYDAVYSSATLHHIEPVSDAMQTIAHFIVPGGLFFLSDENGYSMIQQLAVQKRIGWTKPRTYWRVDSETGEKFLYGNENIRAPYLWSRHIKRAGLIPETIKYCRFLPPLDWPIDRLVRAERRVRAIPLAAQLGAIGFLLASRKPL